MMFRARKKISREVSIYEPIGMDKEGNEISLLDICELEQSDVIDKIDNEVKYKILYHLLNTVLDEREKQIIRMRFGLSSSSGVLSMEKEMTQREIGRILGISRSYVSRIEKRALAKLKTGLLREGFQK